MRNSPNMKRYLRKCALNVRNVSFLSTFRTFKVYHPRITPNGQFMLVACCDSHVIQVFKINKKTGMMVDAKQDMF